MTHGHDEEEGTSYYKSTGSFNHYLKATAEANSHPSFLPLPPGFSPLGPVCSAISPPLFFTAACVAEPVRQLCYKNSVAPCLRIGQRAAENDDDEREWIRGRGTKWSVWQQAYI